MKCGPRDLRWVAFNQFKFYDNENACCITRTILFYSTGTYATRKDYTKILQYQVRPSFKFIKIGLYYPGPLQIYMRASVTKLAQVKKEIQ